VSCHDASLTCLSVLCTDGVRLLGLCAFILVAGSSALSFEVVSVSLCLY
jgi:hypothetical protein